MEQCCHNPQLETTKHYGLVCLNCMSIVNDLFFEDLTVQDSFLEHRNNPTERQDRNKEMELSSKMMISLDSSVSKILAELVSQLRIKYKKEFNNNFYKRENVLAYLCDRYNIEHEFKYMKNKEKLSEMTKWLKKNTPSKLPSNGLFNKCEELGWTVNCRTDNVDKTSASYSKSYFSKPWTDRIEFWSSVIKSG